MAAGLGFKTFATGDVLSAADTNGYLMQGVLVFASAAARDSSITSPQEGQFAYLKDTNVTTYYTGSAWTNLDTTGMTNPMTTTGDMVYSSSGSTPARLGIGSTGQVITVAGGIPSWATPSSGALTLVKQASFSAVATTGTTFDGVFTSTYKNYMVVLEISGSSNGAELMFRLRSGTTTLTTNYGSNRMLYNGSTQTNSQATTYINPGAIYSSGNNSNFTININPRRSGSGAYSVGSFLGYGIGSGAMAVGGFEQFSAAPHDGFILENVTGTCTGQAWVYGLAVS